MRVLLKGTLDQVREVAAILAKPRDRKKQWKEILAAQEKNKKESDLMRAAFLAVRNNPAQRKLADSFAKAIYGDRSDFLLDAAKALTPREKP